MRRTLVAAAAITALAAPAGTAAWAQDSILYGLSPQPGQCFARVTIPEVAESYTETVLVSPARTEVREIPARYEVIDVQVLVSEPRTDYVTIPAVYQSVTDTELVEPAREEPVVIPAATQTYSERVLVRPAYVTWKPGGEVFGRTSGSDELLCRIEVPAEYATLQRVRVVTPSYTSTRAVPARTRQVTRQVLVTPERTEPRSVPAQWRTMKDRRLVAPASQELVNVPEDRRTETRRRVISPARTEWREVLCEANSTPAKIAEIQRALTARGHPVRADGAFGPETLRAMEAFQRANNLAAGYLTVETATALGVSPR